MRNRGSDWFRRPDLILSDLVTSHARSDDRDRHYRRAVVLAVDLEGGLLQNSNGTGEISVRSKDGQVRKYPSMVGPDNPRGSIKARILTDGLDRLLSDEDLRVFWPMFPQDQISVPISPGEHVYIVFEDEGLTHGLWISRVPGQESANSFIGVDSYNAPSAPNSAMDSFEPNDPEYNLSEEHASMAPPIDAMSFFERGNE